MHWGFLPFRHKTNAELTEISAQQQLSAPLFVLSEVNKGQPAEESVQCQRSLYDVSRSRISYSCN